MNKLLRILFEYLYPVLAEMRLQAINDLEKNLVLKLLVDECIASFNSINIYILYIYIYICFMTLNHWNGL